MMGKAITAMALGVAVGVMIAPQMRSRNMQKAMRKGKRMINKYTKMMPFA